MSGVVAFNIIVLRSVGLDTPQFSPYSMGPCGFWRAVQLLAKPPSLFTAELSRVYSRNLKLKFWCISCCGRGKHAALRSLIVYSRQDRAEVLRWSPFRSEIDRVNSCYMFEMH